MRSLVIDVALFMVTMILLVLFNVWPPQPKNSLVACAQIWHYSHKLLPETITSTQLTAASIGFGVILVGISIVMPVLTIIMV